MDTCMNCGGELGWDSVRGWCAACCRATSDYMPSAYSVATLADGRFYPMRFGQFRRDSQRGRISFGRMSDAIRYCRREEHEYERLYPVKGR